jgi:hypothetical protein
VDRYGSYTRRQKKFTISALDNKGPALDKEGPVPDLIEDSSDEEES